MSKKHGALEEAVEVLHYIEVTFSYLFRVGNSLHLCDQKLFIDDNRCLLCTLNETVRSEKDQTKNMIQ